MIKKHPTNRRERLELKNKYEKDNPRGVRRKGLTEERLDHELAELAILESGRQVPRKEITD